MIMTVIAIATPNKFLVIQNLIFLIHIVQHFNIGPNVFVFYLVTAFIIPAS